MATFGKRLNEDAIDAFCPPHLPAWQLLTCCTHTLHIWPGLDSACAQSVALSVAGAASSACFLLKAGTAEALWELQMKYWTAFLHDQAWASTSSCALVHRLSKTIKCLLLTVLQQRLAVRRHVA